MVEKEGEVGEEEEEASKGEVGEGWNLCRVADRGGCEFLGSNNTDLDGVSITMACEATSGASLRSMRTALGLLLLLVVVVVVVVLLLLLLLLPSEESSVDVVFSALLPLLRLFDFSLLRRCLRRDRDDGSLMVCEARALKPMSERPRPKRRRSVEALYNACGLESTS